jgi:hypothetical protein
MRNLADSLAIVVATVVAVGAAVVFGLLRG